MPRLALAAIKLPDIVTRFDVLLNVNPPVAFALPESLNNTSVLLPLTTKLPVMSPEKLPTKVVAINAPFAKFA